MANVIQTEHDLNDGEPDDFIQEFQSWIEIQYKILPKLDPAEEDKYEFSYRRTTTTLDQEGFFASRSTQSDWKPFWSAGVEVDPLDIHIKHGDMIVLVETIDSDSSHKLYWSEHNNAITTQENLKATYGELRYKERDGWKKLGERTSPSTTRLIYFKANLLPPSANDGKKFNYYVRLMNSQGQMIEYKIDPEIKNPSS